MSLRIVREPIDVAALAAAIAAAGYGGVVSFTGVVRDRSDDGHAVNGLSYEAFEPLAVSTFEAIRAEICDRWGDVAIAIAHRIGDLAVGDVAVAVVVAAVHRDAAFEACRYAIDELKQRAPIWKKERYADGGTQWRQNVCGR